MIYILYLNSGKPNSASSEQYCKYLLHWGLQIEYGICLANESILRNEWGKPCLRDHPEIHYNMSHCDGLAACIISKSPAGIDVERIRYVNQYAARHVCSKLELRAIDDAAEPQRAFFRLWTLKESCVKAMGMGLSYPMREIRFNIVGNDVVCLNQPDCHFILWEDTPGCIMAVCRYRRHCDNYRVDLLHQEIWHGRVYSIYQRPQAL